MDLHRNAIIVDYLYIRELLYWQLPCRVNLHRPKVWKLKLRKSILASWIELHGEESENLQRRPDKVQLYKPAHVVSTQQQDFVETIDYCTTPAWIWARIWRPYCWAEGELLTERSLSLTSWQCCWIVVFLASMVFAEKKTYQASISFIILQNRSNSCWLCNQFGGPLLRIQKFNLIYR